MTDFQKPDQSGKAEGLPRTYTQHPLSAAFPPMTAEEFQELKDSIDNIGIQNAITVSDGMVLDGWNRYHACTELGMECPAAELAPGIDARDFVMAQNQARRHVTKAQMAMAVTAVYAWKPLGANQHENRVDTECPPSEMAASATLPSKTTAELSEISGIHANTIKQAKTVTAQATPAVVDAVKRGELGLPKAAAIAKLPPDQQAEAISKPLPRTVSVVPPPKSSQPDELANLEEGDNTLPEGMTEEDFGPTPEEIAEALAHEAAEKAKRELLEKMIESDDQMATLFEEAKMLKAQVARLERYRDELMNKAHAIEQIAKKRDRENLRLRKELDALRGKGGAQ